MTDTPTALARRTNGVTDLIPAAPVQLRNLQEVMQLGDVLAKTGYFKDVRDAGQAVAKILYGMELGVGPMAALMGVHIIENKPSPSANLMATLIKRSGRYNYRVTTWTDKACVIEFSEHGQPCGTASFTWEEASHIQFYVQGGGKKALTSKDVWQNYPKAMLFSRAISQGARAFCADVFGGAPVYTAEELDAPVTVDADGEIVYSPPPPTEGADAQEDRAAAEWAAQSAPQVGNGHRPGDPWQARPVPAAAPSTPAPPAPPPLGSNLTAKQLTAIYAIGRAAAGLREEEVDTRCQAAYHGRTPSELSRAEASLFIDTLKGLGGDTAPVRPLPGPPPPALVAAEAAVEAVADTLAAARVPASDPPDYRLMLLAAFRENGRGQKWAASFLAPFNGVTRPEELSAADAPRAWAAWEALTSAGVPA